MKLLRKTFFYLLLGLFAVVIGLTLSAFIFKDRIIQAFVYEANKRLNTPVQIGKIDISVWKAFPNLTINFEDVYVEDSHPEKKPLLTARYISFSINPIEIWNGNYQVRALRVDKGLANLEIDEEGLNNYTILKPSENGGDITISFDLRNIRLTDATVDYHDLQSKQHHIFESESLNASIGVSNNIYRIKAEGDLLSNQIGIGDRVFLKNKSFTVSANIDYNDTSKEVLFNPSTLRLAESIFGIEGDYSFKDKNIISLTAKGQDTDIQTLLALFPESINEKVKQYRSVGDIYFNMTLEGEISSTKSPAIAIAFGCANASLFHPDYQTRMEHVVLEGTFRSPSSTDFSQGELFLKNISGELNEEIFTSNLTLLNLNAPYVLFDFKGDLDASSIENFYPIEKVKDITGRISADISIEGRLALLKNKATAQKVLTNGSILLSHLNFTYGDQSIHFKDLSGVLQFDNNNLAISNVGGALEDSDFLLNGFFVNVVTYLLFENQPIGIETDIKSEFLDVDQLFEIAFGENNSSDYQFSISPLVNLNFNCDVKTLKYRRFKPQNIKGNLLVKNSMAVSRNIQLEAMGGDITLNGIVDAKNPKAIDVVSTFNLTNIDLDSIFYVFENFKQDFIEDRHLKGKTFADVNLDMTLNEHLHLIQETLVADITASLKGGQLNNFDPMQELNRYLDDEGLSQLRFAELQNDFHIENKTVYIPQMEIRSNVTTIQLSGTHTFDQHIDYHIVAPLRNRVKIDSDEAFGAIEDDGTTRAKIYLKITGTTDEYQVGYDKDAIKKKIAGDLKNEVKELKEAFRSNGKKKEKELELQEDDYFDWF